MRSRSMATNRWAAVSIAVFVCAAGVAAAGCTTGSGSDATTSDDGVPQATDPSETTLAEAAAPPPEPPLAATLDRIPEREVLSGTSGSGAWRLMASSGVREPGEICVLIAFGDGGEGSLCGQPDELPSLAHGVVAPADGVTSFVIGMVSETTTSLGLESATDRSTVDTVAHTEFPGVRFFAIDVGPPTDRTLRVEAVDASGTAIAADQITLRSGPPRA